MGSTTPYGLRYPEYAAGADPKLDLQKLAEDVAPRLHRAEPLTGSQITAIASPRIGQLALNTDTGRVVFWNGTLWRPVGGLAAGTVVIGSVSVTTSFQAQSYFIGLGFEEVQFTLVSAPAGTTQTPGLVALAVSDASRCQGSIGAANATVTMFAVTASTDAVSFVMTSSASASVTVNVRNIRLDADGYLRYELSAGSAFTTSANTRFNWRAR